MRKPKITADVRQEQLDNLRGWFPVGSTVYTVLRKVSASGMTRHIGIIAIVGPDDIRHPNYATSVVLDLPLTDDAVKVGGAGMDMGFHVAYNLSHALYGDGYALNHRWL
jgi:hypothetical protein